MEEKQLKIVIYFCWVLVGGVVTNLIIMNTEIRLEGELIFTTYKEAIAIAIVYALILLIKIWANSGQYQCIKTIVNWGVFVSWLLLQENVKVYVDLLIIDYIISEVAAYYLTKKEVSI